MPPETSQRCQADRAAVEAIAKDIVDAGAEHSTVLGQNDVVLGDRQRIRTGSLAFIDEDFEVVEVAGANLNVGAGAIQIDTISIVIERSLQECSRTDLVDAVQGAAIDKDVRSQSGRRIDIGIIATA